MELVDYFPPGEALSFPNALEMLDRAWEEVERARSIIATVTGTPGKTNSPTNVASAMDSKVEASLKNHPNPEEKM